MEGAIAEEWVGKASDYDAKTKSVVGQGLKMTIRKLLATSDELLAVSQWIDGCPRFTSPTRKRGANCHHSLALRACIAVLTTIFFLRNPRAEAPG